VRQRSHRCRSCPPYPASNGTPYVTACASGCRGGGVPCGRGRGRIGSRRRRHRHPHPAGNGVSAWGGGGGTCLAGGAAGGLAPAVGGTAAIPLLPATASARGEEEKGGGYMPCGQGRRRIGSRRQRHHRHPPPPATASEREGGGEGGYMPCGQGRGRPWIGSRRRWHLHCLPSLPTLPPAGTSVSALVCVWGVGWGGGRGRTSAKRPTIFKRFAVLLLDHMFKAHALLSTDSPALTDARKATLP
jgi:hypothetical protein